MTIFNLLLLVLVLVFSTESMAALGSGSSGTMSYDELLLVLRWPPSFCNTNNCDDLYPIPDKFTLHGIWPNKNSEEVDCRKINCGIKYSLQISGSLREDMEKYWPDLLNPKHPERFWVHEYARHGSCFTEFPKQEDYFQTAINFANRIGDVMKMRLSSGQTLQMGQSYKVNDFEPVTIASGTFFPSLRCNKKGRQLHEIVFCTDGNRNPKNCSPSPSVGSKCCDLFKFPTVQQTASEEADLPGCSSEEADPPGSFEEPESLPCSSSCPPGMRPSAISRILPLMQLTFSLTNIFYFLILTF